MTTSILTIVTVFAAMSVIVLALMQQSKSDMGSAFGGGGSQSMFGSRGSANFLSRLTAVMCTIFFLSSLALAYIYSQRAQSDGVVQNSSVIEQTQTTETITDVPAVPELPTIPTATTEVPEVPQIEQPKMAEETAESREVKPVDASEK